MKPYTYLIKHIPTGLVYYGLRTANKVSPQEDLWIHYFTSSPKVHKLIEETGKDSFLTEIRQVFDSTEKAVNWEPRVLRRCKVLHDPKWINQNIAGYIVPTEESNKKISDFHKDKPKTEEHKRNLSLSQKGKPKKYIQTIEHKRKNSLANSGKNNPMYGPCTSERAANISAAKKGKPAHNKNVPMSEEQKEKIRATKAANPTKRSAEAIAKTVAKQTGQKREKLFCPHCKRDISVGWYNRHGDNCQSYK
jgi:hypothetical protein